MAKVEFAPFDARECVVMLVTFGCVSWVCAVVALVAAGGSASWQGGSWLPGVLALMGVVCMVGAGVVRALGGK